MNKRSSFLEFILRHAPGIIVALSAGLGIERLFRYVPTYTNDSWGYLHSAYAISQGNYFAVDNGLRPPLFPLFLALTGESPRVMFACHLVFGILISLLLFKIFKMVTGSSLFGMVVAIVYILNPSTVVYQTRVLTETLITLLVTLGTYFAVRTCSRRSRLVPGLFLTSLVFCAAALTRPEWQLMPLFITAVILILSKPKQLGRRQISRAVMAGLIPFFVLIIGWSTINYARFRWFTFSTLTGYDLTQFFGPYLGEAPARYKTLAEIFLRYREIHLQRTRWPYDVIWQARPAMLKATGMTDAELSRTLMGISIHIFFRHPDVYFRQVIRSFKVFWRPPVYARGCNLPDLIQGLKEVAAGRASPVRLYAYLYVLFDLAFALALVGPLFRRRWRPLLWSGGVLVMNAVIFYEAVVSSFGNPEDNNRYKLPVESLILGIAFILVFLVIKELRERAGGEVEVSHSE